ncbi:MAG TPA: enoyl-CoA hydratase-related protein [Rubrivivax sp.]|nr:enoyl-CoA hydratase-related protein [Rubrivivax sp.]
MSELDVQVRDGVATLTLDHPASRNALSLSMKAALAAAAADVAADADVRALVITGAGGAFCAGGDLRGMEEHRPVATVQSWRERMRALHPLIRTLVTLDKPLIAAVDGAAYGAGFSLALTADFVLASPQARFCMSFMRMGLVPDFAAMYTLPRVVGVQRARELMLSARELGAQEAQQLGIVLEIVPAPALLARAHEIAAGFVGASPLAVSHIKAGLGMSLATDLDRALADEADHQALCFETESHRDAVRRFLAKEPAAFRWPPPRSTGA